MEMTEDETYTPEYAKLPAKESNGAKGRTCPECGVLGETDTKIATERADGKYLLWTVWYCEDCEKRWRAPVKPWRNLRRQAVDNPAAYGCEVVGKEFESDD